MFKDEVDKNYYTGFDLISEAATVFSIMQCNSHHDYMRALERLTQQQVRKLMAEC